MSEFDPIDAVIFLPIGFLLALVYFALLRLNVRLYLEGRHRWLAIALHVARIGGTAGLFVLFAMAGAVPLLSALAGLLVGRAVALRIARRAA